MNSPARSPSAPPPCWICGDPADTAEHKLKRSDAKASFGKLTQKQPAFLHTDQKRNQRIQTLRSPLLSFKNQLCGPCNNDRTQDHDEAWEALSAALRQRRPTLHEGAHVRTNRVWRDHTRKHMQNVHLYFVKALLGNIVDGDAAFDRATFSRAILSGKAHPNVYIKVGLFDGIDGRVVAGASDLQVQYYADSGRPAFAAWRYEPGSGVAVLVMFAADGEYRAGLDGAWHPKHATTRLTIADFND